MRKARSGAREDTHETQPQRNLRPPWLAARELNSALGWPLAWGLLEGNLLDCSTAQNCSAVPETLRSTANCAMAAK
jgi:hypothetical protein